VFEPDALKAASPVARGLNASPGAGCGAIVFTAEAAVGRSRTEPVILVRLETSPEDLAGMYAARGILTARGGASSHAAVVARGAGLCCVSGCSQLKIDEAGRTLEIDGPGGVHVLREGDYLSIDGTTGEIYLGRIPTVEPDLTGDFTTVMGWADEFRRLRVRANADTPKDAAKALEYGAEGIGLARTEHMFFEDERIPAIREMIVSDTPERRKAALAKLLPFQRRDFEGLFRAMGRRPVTIRLLDPPLHEFLPQDDTNQREMAIEMGLTYEGIKHRVDDLHEANPMMGLRGCRLGITYPEITEMQARAIFEAALNVKAQGIATKVEIMIPLVGTVREFSAQAKVIRDTAETVFAERGATVEFMIGTMIETPRGALVADSIGRQAEFFSFGTNDLTQMTLGFSRDDVGKFLPNYLKAGMYETDPFQSIDQKGVGQLVQMAAEKGRSVRPDIKLGVCGEHGGDPDSVEFFHRAGLDYVSCSPFRVPIARLAAAQAAISDGK
jgi:pyruvate,orthophosphate dikinase